MTHIYQLYLLLLCVFMIISCSKPRQEIPQNNPALSDSHQSQSGITVLSFDSKETLDKAIQNNISPELVKRTIITLPFYLRGSLEKKEEPSLVDLVPDDDFRRYLTSDGEIIVNDTLYKITQHGTLYTDTKHISELYQYYSLLPDTEETLIGDDTYMLGNVYRYDTFKGVSFEKDIEDTIDENLQDSNSMVRSTSIIPSPNVNSFPIVNSSKHTIVGKWLQDIGAKEKHFTAKFPKNNKLRLNCWMFDYKYVIKSSIGISAKIQHKTWVSWAKVSSWDEGALRIGLRNVIIKYKYPKGFPPFYKIYNEMHNFDREKDVTTYVKALPVPQWFFKSPFCINVPIIDKTYSPRYLDLMEVAFNESSKKFQEILNYQKYPHLEYDGLSSVIPRSLREKLSLDDIKKMIVVGTPVYAEDGIYVLYPYGEMLNLDRQKDDQNTNQITMRFGKNFGAFNLKLSKDMYNLADWSNIKGGIRVYPAEDAGTFVAGEVYACGYHDGDWVGFLMEWKR